jgi:hypothetical protein
VHVRGARHAPDACKLTASVNLPKCVQSLECRSTPGLFGELEVKRARRNFERRNAGGWARALWHEQQAAMHGAPGGLA